MDFISSDSFLGVQFPGDESARVDSAEDFARGQQLVFRLAFARGSVRLFIIDSPRLVASDLAGRDAPRVGTRCPAGSRRRPGASCPNGRG